MMFEALRKYAEFEGRARRSEYWLFALFQALVAIALTIVMVLLGVALDAGQGQMNPAFGLVFLLFALFGLAMFIPNLAVSIRRLHDSDKSGWWLLLHFAPFGGIVILVFTLLDGTPGPNRYGPDPKGREGYGPGPVVHNHYYPPSNAPTPSDQPLV